MGEPQLRSAGVRLSLPLLSTLPLVHSPCQLPRISQWAFCLYQLHFRASDSWASVFCNENASSPCDCDTTRKTNCNCFRLRFCNLTDEYAIALPRSHCVHLAHICNVGGTWQEEGAKNNFTPHVWCSAPRQPARCDGTHRYYAEPCVPCVLLAMTALSI